MQPARGDTRPCSNANCVGTMRFGWESTNDPGRGEKTLAFPSTVLRDTMGWICSHDPVHFRKQD
jgi:hypothetical protein